MLELLLIIGCTVNCSTASKAYKAERPQIVRRVEALAPTWAAPVAPILTGRARLKLSKDVRLQYRDEETFLLYNYSF